jgi:hypothetical protein
MSTLTETDIRNCVIPSHIRATSTYQPVSHSDALDAMEIALNGRGYQIRRNNDGSEAKQFTLDKQRLKMVGMLPLTMQIDPEVRMMVGIMNSLDKSMALRVGFGSQVMVCTNGCFFATRVVRAKHTPGVLDTMHERLDSALNVLDDLCTQQSKFFERLRDVKLTDKDAYHLTGRMAREHEVIPAGDIIKVIDEWHSPAYDDFKGRTAWSLHNAVTEASKKTARRNGSTFTDRTQQLSTFMAREFASDLSLTPTAAADPSMNAALLN